MNHKIITLNEYVNQVKEDFYNPFEEEEVDKTPKQIGDHGGMLKARKETFNINRVEYSKRANGKFTVLSKTQFGPNEIVEICPVLFVGIEAKAIEGINDYIFEIDKNKHEFGVVLGYGSLYQHSETPNMQFAYNKSNKQMYFTSIRMVNAGEELTINYGKDYWDERQGFGVMGTLPKPEPAKDEDKELEESSGLQSNAAMQQDELRTHQFGSPKNPGNPAISGVAIMGPGQS